MLRKLLSGLMLHFAVFFHLCNKETSLFRTFYVVPVCNVEVPLSSAYVCVFRRENFDYHIVLHT